MARIVSLVAVLLLSCIHAIAASTCSRQVAVGLQNPSKAAIGFSDVYGHPRKTMKGSSTTYLNINSSTLHYVSFYPSPKTIKIFFPPNTHCKMAAKLGFLAPSGYHWQLSAVTNSEICSGKQCAISTGSICGSKMAYIVELGKDVASTVVITLFKGPNPECGP